MKKNEKQITLSQLINICTYKRLVNVSFRVHINTVFNRFRIVSSIKLLRYRIISISLIICKKKTLLIFAFEQRKYEKVKRQSLYAKHKFIY